MPRNPQPQFWGSSTRRLRALQSKRYPPDTRERILGAELRTRVRAFLSDDDSHAYRPGVPVHQPGQICDPGAVTDVVVRVNRRPRPVMDLGERSEALG